MSLEPPLQRSPAATGGVGAVPPPIIEFMTCSARDTDAASRADGAESDVVSGRSNTATLAPHMKTGSGMGASGSNASSRRTLMSDASSIRSTGSGAMSGRQWLMLPSDTPAAGAHPVAFGDLPDVDSMPMDLVGVAPPDGDGTNRVSAGGPTMVDVPTPSAQVALTLGSFAGRSATVAPGIMLLGSGAFGTVFAHFAKDPTRGPESSDAYIPFARKQIGLASGDPETSRVVRTELAVCQRIAALQQQSSTEALGSSLPKIHAIRAGAMQAAIDMELFDDGSITQLAPLADLAKLTRIARGILRGLRVLHEHVRALHRDIKGANVLLSSKDGVAKLVDFGCVALFNVPHNDEEAAAVAAGGAELIATDQNGSLSYMAPERLRGEPHGTPSDVWSVGVTLVELVLGEHPFIPAGKCHGLGSTERFWALAQVLQHTAAPDECTAAVNTAVDAALRRCAEKTASPALQQFLARCLRADPSARASVTELLNDPFILAVRP